MNILKQISHMSLRTSSYSVTRMHSTTLCSSSVIVDVKYENNAFFKSATP